MDARDLELASLELSYARLRIRDRRAENRLMLALEQHGQQNPIWVVPGAEAGRYEVIDGNKRVRALRRLKADVVRAAIWEMSAAEALVRAYQTGSCGGWSALEEAWLIYELVRVQGWDLDAVSARMDRSKSWVSRRLGLAEILPERVQDLVQKGRIGAYAAAKHLLPLARANGPGCERLAEKLGEIGLRSRQVAVVCEHYGCGRGRVAERILEDPARFVKAFEQARKGPQEPGLSDAENRCLRNLEIMGNISLGLARSLPKVLNYDTMEDAWVKLWGAWERSRESFRLLERAAKGLKRSTDVNEEGNDHVGSGNEDGRLDFTPSGSREPDDRQGPRDQPGRGAGCDRQRTGSGTRAPSEATFPRALA